MNFHQYYPIDVVNGPGTRCTLFVSGCEHQCRGCYNQSTWPLDSGKLFTQEDEDRILKDLADTNIVRQGLSLSGGDPLHPNNLAAILHLVKRVKLELPEKDIWLWTGYSLNQLNQHQQYALNFIDVLIDGKFIQSQYQAGLLWRGSSNQNIHYLKQVV